MNQAINKMKENIWNIPAPSSQTATSHTEDRQPPEQTEKPMKARERPQKKKQLPPRRQAQPLKPKTTKPLVGVQKQQGKDEAPQPPPQQQEFLVQQTAVNVIKRSIFKLPPPTVLALPQKPRQINKQEKHKNNTNKTHEDSTKAGQGNGKDDAEGRETDESLERMSGIFWCNKCQKRWRSQHVYCLKGTKKAQYGQICAGCRAMIYPARIRKIRCVTCDQVECDCEVKRAPLIEPKYAHRPDLCVKCLSGDPCVP